VNIRTAPGRCAATTAWPGRGRGTLGYNNCDAGSVIDDIVGANSKACGIVRPGSFAVDPYCRVLDRLVHQRTWRKSK
jgi:hypothetical protein